MKQSWKPGTMIYPLPAVIVTCGTAERSNMLTVAWTGILSTNPPMCYISVRPERYSYDMLRERMEFTINLTTEAMAHATDFVGVRSGLDIDKWQATGLTPLPGVKVACPAIDESPLSLECRVKQVMDLGSHHMFIADIINVLADERYIDPTTDKFRLEDAGLMTYSHGQYFGQGEPLGHFGFSVKKKNR